MTNEENQGKSTNPYLRKTLENIRNTEGKSKDSQRMIRGKLKKHVRKIKEGQRKTKGETKRTLNET